MHVHKPRLWHGMSSVVFVLWNCEKNEWVAENACIQFNSSDPCIGLSKLIQITRQIPANLMDGSQKCVTQSWTSKRSVGTGF